MKIKYSIPILFGLIFLIGCATTNHNYFQTGKPVGKKNSEQCIGLSLAAATDYDITYEEGRPTSIEFEEGKKLAPILSIQQNWGITENIDAGIGAGVGLISINIRGFAKLCLLDKNQKMNVGLLPAFNVSFTPDTILGFDLTNSVNVNFYVSLPISVDLGKNVIFTIRPTLGREYTRVSVKYGDDDDPKNYHESIYFTGKGVSAGFKFLLKDNNFFFPEVNFITYDNGVHFTPFYGIGFKF